MAFGFARKMDKKPIRLSKKRIFFFFCDETIPDSAFLSAALHDADERHPSGQQAVPQ
jgi:hypothetical protein